MLTDTPADVRQGRRGYMVEDAVPIPAIGEHAPGLEQSQVPADRRLGQADTPDQFAHREVLVQQHGYHAQVIGMADGAQAAADPLQVDANKWVVENAALACSGPSLCRRLGRHTHLHESIPGSSGEFVGRMTA